MKVYGISGLGADKRVFDYLNLNFELITIDWIIPLPSEPIESYAKRLSSIIDDSTDFCIIGVSFGGLIATEINKVLSPKKVILISSVHTKNELRSIYRRIGQLKIIRSIPVNLFNPPRFIAKYIMGANNAKLLYKILDDTDLYFVKWALHELTTWKNIAYKNNVIKINGTSDKLIPPRGITKMYLIENGEHFMIVDRAQEISELINLELQ